MSTLSAFHREKSTKHGFSSYPTAWWPCFATAITYHTHREKNEVQLQMLYQRFKTMWSASNCLPLSHLHCQGQRPSLSYPSAGRALAQSALWLLVHMGDSISEVQEEQMANPPQARQPQLHQTPVPLYSTNSSPHRNFREVHVPVHMMFGSVP